MNQDHNITTLLYMMIDIKKLIDLCNRFKLVDISFSGKYFKIKVLSSLYIFKRIFFVYLIHLTYNKKIQQI